MCPQCGAGFGDASNLRDHMRKKHKGEIIFDGEEYRPKVGRPPDLFSDLALKRRKTDESSEQFDPTFTHDDAKPDF